MSTRCSLERPGKTAWYRGTMESGSWIQVHVHVCFIVPIQEGHVPLVARTGRRCSPPDAIETGTSGNSGDGGPQKGNGKEETDEPDLPPEVAGLIMNVLRPCLLSSAKGRCVLALLLR